MVAIATDVLVVIATAVLVTMVTNEMIMVPTVLTYSRYRNLVTTVLVSTYWKQLANWMGVAMNTTILVAMVTTVLVAMVCTTFSLITYLQLNVTKGPNQIKTHNPYLILLCGYHAIHKIFNETWKQTTDNYW